MEAAQCSQQQIQQLYQQIEKIDAGIASSKEKRNQTYKTTN